MDERYFKSLKFTALRVQVPLKVPLQCLKPLIILEMYAVSKTACRGFEPFCPCQSLMFQGFQLLGASFLYKSFSRGSGLQKELKRYIAPKPRVERSVAPVDSIYFKIYNQLTRSPKYSQKKIKPSAQWY